MVVQTWGTVFIQTFQNLWNWVILSLPDFLFAIIVLIVGWLVASMIGKGLAHLINAAKLDSLLKTTGFDELVAKAGFKLNSGAFIGGLVKWFLIIIFLAASLDILGLNEVNAFLTDKVLTYLPSVIIAVLFILAGFIVGEIASTAVRATARAAGVRLANMLGSVAKWAIVVSSFIIALQELGIAETYTSTIVIAVMGMIALAGGLAFGLGGKEHASRVLDRVHDMVRRD